MVTTPAYHVTDRVRSLDAVRQLFALPAE